MRIALAGISHETNTYCTTSTPLSDFHVSRGEKMLSASGQESDLGGAVDACHQLGVDIVPILFAHTQPSGLIEYDAYHSLKSEILEQLALVEPVDACVLLLHGAGVVDGCPDLEGDLAQHVRDLLGPIPITASFDLHANLTQHMADQLDGVFVCRQYPHVDMHVAAADAVGFAAALVTTERRGRCQLTWLPLLLPTTTTFEGIGAEMLDQLLEHQGDQAIVNLSWCHGFPYTDVPHVGSSVVCTTLEDDQGAGLTTALRFAETLWDSREAFRPTSLDADEALALAAATEGSPVVIHETSDNCGGGTPGDGTHLLAAMLEAKLGRDACFSFLVDAEVAAQAHAAGVGASIDIVLGGKTDDLHGAPLALRAYVKALHDGQLVLQHMFKGMPLHLGPMAHLLIEDMSVVVASRRSQTFDREPFLAVGIEVERYKYVALKSSNHFRAGFTHIAAAIVTADTPGLTTHHIERFERQSATRPLWPLDNRAAWSPNQASLNP